MKPKSHIRYLSPFWIASLFFVELLFAPVQSEEKQIWNLSQCYQSALKKSETLSISEKQIDQAEAEYGEVLGKAFPEFSFSYQLFKQDQSGVSDIGGVGSTLTQGFQREGKFTVSKQLLTGYRELAAIRGGSSHVEQKKLEFQRAQQLLFGDVSQAFFGALRSDLNVNSTHEVRKLVVDRLKELQSRVRVGRSRLAEVVSMEYRLTVLDNQLEDALRERATAMDFLSFLTGEPVSQVDSKVLLKEKSLSSLENCLSRISSRPDVQAKRKIIEASYSFLKMAKAGHWPSLGFTGNYYIERPGFRDPIDWDVTLGLTVPLWSWGSTQKGVEKEYSLLHQSELEERETLRRSEFEIREAYRNFLSFQRKSQLLTKGREQAKKQYELDLADYRRGWVTNFEVLEALNLLLEAELAGNTAVLNEHLASIDLDLAQGYSPEEILP